MWYILEVYFTIGLFVAAMSLLGDLLFAKRNINFEEVNKLPIILAMISWTGMTVLLWPLAIKKMVRSL